MNSGFQVQVLVAVLEVSMYRSLHDEDVNPPMDIDWIFVDNGKIRYSIRDPHAEALRSLKEADMLPEVTLEEVPA
jgi:hypothetical protein